LTTSPISIANLWIEIAEKATVLKITRVFGFRFVVEKQAGFSGS
jgi:hypothetical protein